MPTSIVYRMQKLVHQKSSMSEFVVFGKNNLNDLLLQPCLWSTPSMNTLLSHEDTGEEFSCRHCEIKDIYKIIFQSFCILVQKKLCCPVKHCVHLQFFCVSLQKFCCICLQTFPTPLKFFVPARKSVAFSREMFAFALKSFAFPQEMFAFALKSFAFPL